jgi:hypothetical protein
MAKAKTNGPGEDEVWNAILACEQILEAMPNDRHSLRTLTNAYEQVGDLVRAKEYMIRLAETVLAEEDASEAMQVRERLLTFADDAHAQELMALLEQLTPGQVEESGAPAQDRGPARPGQPLVPSVKKVKTWQLDLNEEIALAWTLQQEKIISEEDYSGIVNDLTRLSTGEAKVTVSVLHVLHDRGFAHIDRAMNVLARKFSCPILSLASFQLPREAVVLLPIEFCVKRGALVFETMGDHALVAVLNPQDEQLRRAVEAETKRACHFYLVAPADFDAAVDRVRKVLAGTPDEPA